MHKNQRVRRRPRLLETLQSRLSRVDAVYGTCVRRLQGRARKHAGDADKWYTGLCVRDTGRESREATGKMVRRGFRDGAHKRVAGSTQGTAKDMLSWAVKQFTKRRGPTGHLQRRYVISRVCRHVAHRNESLGHAEILSIRIKMPAGEGLRRQLRARQDTVCRGSLGPPKRWAPSPRCRPGVRRCQNVRG